jgi:asparagine synthase (glutamine-hydrolysing)
MCGIVAEYHPGQSISPALLRMALQAIRHRGPDGEGIWIGTNQGVGLGHVRLAILDLAGSPQPITNEDASIVVTVNGEFYDHERIRRQLERRGHRFSTGGDSEIAVHLYEEFGTDFLDHLRGEFALILWDGTRGQLIAARDRFGIKPLCWARQGDRVLVSSEAKALFAMGVPPAWDEEALFQIASMQYLPPDHTLFAGIQQLRPGHLLVATQRRICISSFWDMKYPQEEEKLRDDPALLGLFRDKLDEAIRLRLRADVPIAFHLSGGLDSSSVVALASRHLRRPAACFTVGFDLRGYDELEQARESAVALGADWYPVPLNQADLIAALSDAIWFSEGLAINNHLPAKYLLARTIRQAGYPVVLSGEGADEILAGYAHLRQDLWASDQARLFRLAVDNRMVAGMHLPEGNTLPLAHVEKTLGYIPTFLQAKASLGLRLHSLLRQEYRQRFRGDPFALFLNTIDLDCLVHRHRVDQSSYLWSKSALANYILRTLGDGTEMAHAVEGRLPFLDHELFDFARQIPTSAKIRDQTEKWLLREALADRLPTSVYSRPKQPFTAPPCSLLTGRGGYELLADILFGNALIQSPFFDTNLVRQAVERLPQLPEREQLAWDPVLMLVLTACLAQERFALRT